MSTNIPRSTLFLLTKVEADIAYDALLYYAEELYDRAWRDASAADVPDEETLARHRAAQVLADKVGKMR